MDKPELRRLLDEIATERLTEDYTITQHRESYELQWVEDNLERSVITRHTNGCVSIETSAFYDDYDANERSWEKDEIADVSKSYPSVISAAIQTAITQVQNVTKDDLDVIDRLPNQ